MFKKDLPLYTDWFKGLTSQMIAKIQITLIAYYIVHVNHIPDCLKMPPKTKFFLFISLLLPASMVTEPPDCQVQQDKDQNIPPLFASGGTPLEMDNHSGT
ncbi:uncharacterized protein LOC128219615 isoform X2 [Mya arenaria]|uniref:uncharacterized protein LOC128219615 isoform X2 n=1 Tax=Mya arenaria TaxID=6604 RepID=UPI0022E47741|nr:uncharacterized protein LOC128219615 isoform X2 [Mya arenaria]